MKILIERSEPSFMFQLDIFTIKAPNYNTLLGVPAAGFSQLLIDYNHFKYNITVIDILQSNAEAVVSYKNAIRNLAEAATLGVFPALKPLPTAPTGTPIGDLEKQFRKIVRTMVDSPNFTETIAKDLGLLAPQQQTDSAMAANATPEFKIMQSSGGYPLLVWKALKFDGVVIYKSTDGVNFAYLDKDFKPDFTDKSPLPQAPKAEHWYYKMRYLLNDEEVGSWSNVKSIVVSG